MKSAAVLLTLALACSAQAQSALGYDVPDCGTWVRQNDPAHRWWLLGFMTGINSGLRHEAKGDPLQGLKGDQIFLWMDNFCKANPLKNVHYGANTLYAELHHRAGSK
ncbi:hypothetical protein WG922_13545 [Ramlibacter sp. AN1015]|uniref:hypothetical protein n=1 Tax=Ramlibacter sp. AN1015 TaxID=3133428 RepID=UPI0030BC65EC